MTTTLVEDVLPPNTVAQYASDTHMVPENELVVSDPPRVLGKGGFGEVCGNWEVPGGLMRG